MRNNMGPNTDPWGTPLITGLQLDSSPSTTTLCFLPDNQSLTQFTTLSPIPWDFNLISNRWWGTLSNAFWKSRKPMQNYVRQSRGRWRRAATLKWCGKCGMQMKENGRAWASRRITVNENFVPETRRRGRCCCHLGTKIKLTCDVACRQNE